MSNIDAIYTSQERRSQYRPKYRQSDFALTATNSDRRPAPCPGSRINPWVLLLDPPRQSDLGDPENSPGYVGSATLASLRGPSLESPQGSEMNLFALAASTTPRALLS